MVTKVVLYCKAVLAGQVSVRFSNKMRYSCRWDLLVFYTLLHFDERINLLLNHYIPTKKLRANDKRQFDKIADKTNSKQAYGQPKTCMSTQT